MKAVRSVKRVVTVIIKEVCRVVWCEENGSGNCREEYVGSGRWCEENGSGNCREEYVGSGRWCKECSSGNYRGRECGGRGIKAA